MQKITIFILLITLVCSLDYCTLYMSYETCVSTKVDQCRWMPLFSECIQSDNYLMGCDSTLSEKLCVRQIGTVLGELAQCVFKDNCHSIPDPNYAKCSDTVTRSGCLSISNKEQRCKWQNNKCLTLSDEDYKNLQNTFMDMELSVSVCPLITSYLIMHHSVLWPLTSYEPDLIEESDNQVLEDEGQYVPNEPTYQTSGTLNNNYVDSSGNYVWYQYKVTKASTATNFKINDQTRYGCIALEILSDSDFLTYFSLRGDIKGVNHIYCKYLSRHPTDPQFSIFKDNQCTTITEQQLKDDYYVQSNKITCQMMGGYVCQRLLVKSLQCMIYGGGEFDCVNYNPIKLTTNTLCDQRTGTATYMQCQQNDYCFLNTQSAAAFCDNTCSLKPDGTTCSAQSQCIWKGPSQDSVQGVLIYCIPYNGCQTMGLSKGYCKYMASQCYWNEDDQRCQDSEDIATITCEQANTVFTCTTITRYDQYCIWFKETCINIKKQPLISHFKSLPSGIMMNRNTCVQMESEYYYYVSSTKLCPQTIQITMKCLDKSLESYSVDKVTPSLPCTNTSAQHINKYFCLNFLGQYTMWDQYNLRCINLVESQLKQPCASFKLVNPQVCSQTLIPDTQYCFYDDKMYSCYTVEKSSHALQCTDKGLSKAICTSITTQGQYCQWSYGACRSLIYRNILPYKCNSLLSVNGNACAYFTTEVSCLYDPSYTSCAVGYGPESKCTNNLNPQGCQESTASCYYDFNIYKCKDTTTQILNTISCASSYLSKTACAAVSTPNQACVWDSTNNKCINYTTQYSITCTTYDAQNGQVCKNLQSSFVNYFLDGTYCELINGVCTATRDSITGCGSDRDINIHRCVAHTSDKCFFDSQLQCTKVYDDGYQNVLMNYLNCTQVNVQLCGLITTKGQTCWVVDNNSNVKCSYYSSSQVYTCAQLNAINTSNSIGLDSNGKRQWFNRNMCYLATDSCYFDVDTNKCTQDSSKILPCNSPGLNKIFCLTQTIGQCVYNTRTCEYINDLTTDCTLRNHDACFVGVQKCKWDETNKKCIANNTQTCPTTYASTSYLNCGVSQDTSCWAYKNGCSDIDVQDMPCNLYLAKGLCSNLNHMCFWINNKCQAYDQNIHKCINASTLSECMLNLTNTEFCAYSDGKCFAVTGNKCDQYDKVSMNYCLQFPDCIYDQTNNVCIDIKRTQFYASNQRDFNNIAGVVCDYQDSMTCLYQKSQACINSYGCGTSWNPDSECPILLDEYWGDNKSAGYCYQFPNCFFLGTRDGQQGICYQDEINCEKLSQDYCLSDFPELMCQNNLDTGECETTPDDVTCETIAGYYVSRSACIKANENSGGNQCYYYPDQYSSGGKCKKMVRDSNIACTDVDTTYADDLISQEIQCIMTDNICYINLNSDGDYESCTDQVTPILNWKACTQQIDNTYYFDMQTYTCIVIDNTISLLGCDNLNNNSCRQLTNVHNNFNCVWSNDKCRQFVYSDAESIECNARNKFTCNKTQTKQCIYINDECIDYTDTLTCNDLTDKFVSPMVCQQAGCLYNGQSCFIISTEPKSYHKCSNLALSQSQCINQTSYVYCYWNETYCDDANLYVIQCNQSVSKQTCLNIKTYGQYCVWDGTTCQTLTPEQPCSTYSNSNNSNGCISLTTQSCFFDSRYNLCKDTQQVYEICYEGLSMKACRQVKNEACVISKGKCSALSATQYQCSSIYNKFGCFYISLNCIWDDEEGCKDFTESLKCNEMPVGVNKYACINMAKPITGTESCDECNCRFDEVTWTCSYQLKGTKILHFEQIDQSGFVQLRMSALCTDNNNYFDCLQNLVNKCKWINSSCHESDLMGCDNQSELACLEVQNDFCSWRDSTCVPWNKNKFETALVTSNVCSLLDQSLNVKYSYEKRSCVQTNFNEDTCDIVSVTMITCLSIKNYPCTYINGTCKTWVANKNYYKCNDYQNITYLVCQASQLACKYNAYQCVPSVPTDECSTIGLSQLGCVNVQSQACYWDNGQCKSFISNASFDQCDTVTIMNSLACSSVSYLNQPCSYDTSKHVCTPRFNKMSGCDMLNQYACYLSESEPCQFINGKCTKFMGGDYKCFQLQQVNALVCRTIITDTCAYDITTNSCFSVLDFVPCSTVGVNSNACSILSNCSWNNDDIQCQCNLIQHKDICYGVNKDNCISQSQCYYYQGTCYKKKCKYLQGAQCTGIVNDEYCYINQNQQCQGAKQCEDIVYLHQDYDCPQFTFSGSACVTINYYCVSSTNLPLICVNSDCSNNACLLDQGICRPLGCSDYSEQDCYLTQGCAYINDQCVQINNCSQITDPAICSLVTVDNKVCSWEEYRLLDDTKVCTNSQCELYGPAYTICNGNEINGKTCVLTNLIKCQMCEELTDICLCNNSNNACAYINGSCKSIACGSYVAEPQCTDSKRCYWSQQDKVCRKMCVQNIRQDQCEALIYECHWNPYMKICEQGVEVIPDLSVDVDLDEVYGIMLSALIILFI